MDAALSFAWLLFAMLYLALGVKCTLLLPPQTDWFWYPIVVILWWPAVVVAYVLEGLRRLL